MAEQKKRGFHALEQRIHEMEEEDAKQQGQGRVAGQQGEAAAERRDQPQGAPAPERK